MLWQDVPLDPRNDASQTATRVLAKEHSTFSVTSYVKLAYGKRKKPGGSIPLGMGGHDPSGTVTWLYPLDLYRKRRQSVNSVWGEKKYVAKHFIKAY